VTKAELLIRLAGVPDDATVFVVTTADKDSFVGRAYDRANGVRWYTEDDGEHTVWISADFLL
jgi:hypothetical protein